MKLLGVICWCLWLCCRPVLAQNVVDVKAYGQTGSNGLFEVLLAFDIQPGWHIFAPYEQMFGAPLRVEWRLPEGVAAVEESFSRTRPFNQEGISFDGYESRAFYKTTLQNTQGYKNFSADISWQACRDECIPGSITLNIPVADTPAFQKVLQNAAPQFAGKDYLPRPNWILILLTAFGGGLILNLMPCVFPILSFKIIALAQMQEHTRRQEAFYYTAGIVVSMTVIAAILAFVRRFNPSAGWGFQLQSPWFVGAMLILFIILSLMMLEVITINGGFLGKLAGLKFNGPRSNAFMTGLLAVLIASPCTAPLMGAAVGYALMIPSYAGFPVFWALGIGYALPFALLALYPEVLRKILPKPGIWMLRLKRILSIPVILTCFWLAWLLASQIGWLDSGRNLDWKEYSAAKVEQALAKKQPVFIDFTAKWCITCLVNKKAALQSEQMAELVKAKNIRLLRADITTPNREAAAGLAAYGRAGVPLYVYYDGKSDDYLILPQILTPGVLEEYLQ